MANGETGNTSLFDFEKTKLSMDVFYQIRALTRSVMVAQHGSTTGSTARARIRTKDPPGRRENRCCDKKYLQKSCREDTVFGRVFTIYRNMYVFWISASLSRARFSPIFVMRDDPPRDQPFDHHSGR